ncbi:MAG: efflux RND transporter periplasmic adaptor subunit [Saprospiraceae bacterium]|nr:efflux RND transporter periplasmic adaptor subunit [Saprospiraceae bacterium]
MKSYSNKKSNPFHPAPLLLILIASLFFSLSSCSHKEDDRAIKEFEPVEVTVIEISVSQTKSNFSVSGNIQAEKEANMSTRIMGFIEDIRAEVGKKVRKGEVLVRINSSDLKAKKAQIIANISQAETAVNNAKKDYDRIVRLFEQKSVTQKELDDITTHYNMANAGLNAAKEMEKEIEAQFAYTRILAPFTGVVTSKYANQGEIANPGMPLLSIAKIDNYQAIAMVPEHQVSSLKVGQKAKVNIKSLDTDIQGTISEIGISSNHTGGQFIVKIDLEKHTHELYMGMYATITFENQMDGVQSTLLIPAESIVKQGGLRGVYTIGTDQTAILRWIRVGKQLGNTYEVLSGLDFGDSLIISSKSRLFNGAKVSIQ